MKKHALLIGARIGLALSLAACSKPPHPSETGGVPPVAPVRAQKVEARAHIAQEEVTGSVRATLHSAIEAKAVGRIEKLLVVPGRKVKQGEALLQLDAREIEAKLDQARAVRDQSEKDLQRYAALIANKVVTQAEFEAVQSRNRVAKAALVEAETNLGYTTILAPFDGVITRKAADVGDLASPGRTLLEMEDPGALRFEADVPEALIGFITSGAKLPVQIGATSVPGVVSEITPVADAQSRTFLVKLDLPPAPGLRTGQFGRAAVSLKETAVLRIPAGAVLQRGQMEIVFVIDNSRAQLRLVKTGKRFGNEVEVVSGIEDAETVVTENAACLIDGQRVEVQSK